MQSHKFLCLLGSPSRWRTGAVSIACWLIGSSALAVPASIDLPGDRTFPENITSTKDGTLYVGSIGAGGIIRVKPGAAKAEIWIKPGAFGSRSTFGILAGETSNTLWVCSNDLSARGVARIAASRQSIHAGWRPFLARFLRDDLHHRKAGQRVRQRQIAELLASRT
jgi:hypothetical protein